MSHPSSRNISHGKANSRRSRARTTPATTGTARQHQTTPAGGKAPSSERRHARRDAAIRKQQQTKQLRLIGGGVVVAILVAAVLIFINRPTSDAMNVDYEGLAVAQPPIAAAGGVLPAPPVAGPTGSYTGTVVGDPDAPVTFIIYSDFQCHFCQQFHEETYPKIVEDFVRAGQVKVEFREYPALGGEDMSASGNGSAQAAEAAMCAAEQDSYLEYHDRLFSNFSADGSGYSVDRLRGFAEDVGLDTDAFSSCIDSDRYLPALELSKADGTALGINATPMFVIDKGNGQPNVVQQTSAGYDLLKRQIQTAIDSAP